MQPGFVTFEGIDGSGKTTVSRRTYEILRERGEKVEWTSEPTHHWLGEAVRKSYRDDVGPLAEAFLFLADRAVHVPAIRGLVRQGYLVLCDRYADSTYAYQGARLEGLLPRPLEFLRRSTEPWYVPPDLTIFLRVQVERGISRISARPERVRFEDPSFLARVAENYERLARSARYVVIDSNRSLDEVVYEAVAAIDRRFGSGRARA